MTTDAGTIGIRFEDVSKAFGDIFAVDGLNLEIEAGEFVSILGPSGCGKTTLLRLLAGLERPTRGLIRIGDKIVNEVPPSRRDIAMVFQTYALYPHMTVAGNIEYPLRKRRVPKQDRRELVQRAAATLQLEQLLQRKPRELSGGQQQRVALGRALVRDPAVFLLDEPLSNLDAKLRSHMRAELIRLHRRIGRTMVYVTHDQLEAMTMSDRIAVIRDGQLQQFATPQEIYSRPTNDFVAGFIGMPPMNIIDGTLGSDGGAVVIRSAGWTLPADGFEVPGLAAGEPVRVGFRPEDVLLGEGEEARVAVVEPTGHEIIIVVEIHGHQIVLRATPETKQRPDDTVRIKPRSGRLHLFGPDGARRDGDSNSGSAQR
jgi:multiple sugar transport system ATP-binding protein